MKEGITRVTALRAGEVDFANLVPREHMERLAKDPQISVLRGKDTQGYENLHGYKLRFETTWVDKP